MKNPPVLPTSLLLTAALCAAACLSSPLRAQVPGNRTISPLRAYAYGKSGEWLYDSLSRIHLPSTRPVPPRALPFRLKVDWARQARENGKGFPLFYPCTLDFNAGTPKTAALLFGYRTRYHDHVRGLFDRYFRWVRSTTLLSPEMKEAALGREKETRERSMVFYLAFRRSQVQCLYYPGKIQFEGGDRRRMGKWLPAATAAERSGKDRGYGVIQDSQGLLAILNGTFDREDNLAAWNVPEPRRRYAGFTYGFRPFLPLQPDMATFALYRDGRVALGSYRNLPRKADILTCVQNRFMVIEDGRPGPDARPNAFCSVYDNIARCYLFTDKGGRIGWIWTLYTPPSVLVPLALEMGVEDMMLLDIHSPVAASLADPKGPYRYSGYHDYERRSFDLIPDFFRLSALQSSIAWMTSALQSRIQTNYPLEAFQNGAEDYFAFFLKGSPEARRLLSPQPSGTEKGFSPQRSRRSQRKDEP